MSLFDAYERVTEKPESGRLPEMRQLFAGAGLLVLTRHVDARGDLIEVFRESWHLHGRAAQVYLSATEADVVKGWHLHQVQTDRFHCVAGRVIVGLWDADAGGVVEVCMRETDNLSLIIGPGIPHGWYNPGPERAVILNCVSHEYDGTDEWRRPADAGPEFVRYIEDSAYNWRRRRDG